MFITGMTAVFLFTQAAPVGVLIFSILKAFGLSVITGMAAGMLSMGPVGLFKFFKSLESDKYHQKQASLNFKENAQGIVNKNELSKEEKEIAFAAIELCSEDLLKGKEITPERREEIIEEIKLG